MAPPVEEAETSPHHFHTWLLPMMFSLQFPFAVIYASSVYTIPVWHMLFSHTLRSPL